MKRLTPDLNRQLGYELALLFGADPEAIKEGDLTDRGEAGYMAAMHARRLRPPSHGSEPVSALIGRLEEAMVQEATVMLHQGQVLVRIGDLRRLIEEVRA